MATMNVSLPDPMKAWSRHRPTPAAMPMRATMYET